MGSMHSAVLAWTPASVSGGVVGLSRLRGQMPSRHHVFEAIGERRRVPVMRQTAKPLQSIATETSGSCKYGNICRYQPRPDVPLVARHARGKNDRSSPKV